MYVSIVIKKPVEYVPLLPALSIRDEEYVREHLSEDTRAPIETTECPGTLGPLKILADYRWHYVYCEGGVRLYRNDSNIDGVNGYLFGPMQDTAEKAIVFVGGRAYNAWVVFT